MGGGNDSPGPVASAPDAPTLDNSEDALKKAREQQAKARGAAATLFSQQLAAPSGSASLLASGSEQSKKMMLGV